MYKEFPVKIPCACACLDASKDQNDARIIEGKKRSPK
jgi:hypothetical protein